jgi:hypothetical protein
MNRFLCVVINKYIDFCMVGLKARSLKRVTVLYAYQAAGSYNGSANHVTSRGMLTGRSGEVNRRKSGALQQHLCGRWGMISG